MNSYLNSSTNYVHVLARHIICHLYSFFTCADLEVRHNNTEERELYYVRKYRNDLTLLQWFSRTSRSAYAFTFQTYKIQRCKISGARQFCTYSWLSLSLIQTSVIRISLYSLYSIKNLSSPGDRIRESQLYCIITSKMMR